VASEPERRGEIDLTVERIDNGEISTCLHEVLIPGDQIEVRGPIGGYFVWEASMPGPLLLVAGGSGRTSDGHDPPPPCREIDGSYSPVVQLEKR
jgi:ferredoxin-NADP reductase